MGTYATSTGERITQRQLDRRIRNAKAKKLQDHLDRYNYFFCEDCKRSDVKPIDCSHDISVKECKETGQSEKAYDVSNITLRCRECHTKKDKTNLQWTPS